MSQAVQKIIKLVVLYCRVSTANQEVQRTIENQLMVLRERAAKEGYTIVHQYIDDGWSGDVLARPDLDQLRNDAKKKLWDAVLIYDPDRLARRYSYQQLVMDELRELGIETLFITIPAATTDDERMMQGVRGVFAEYERVKIAERFRLGKVRKAREGHIITSRSAYGYTLITKRGKPGDANFVQTHYEINEDEARVVRIIFECIANEGLTIRKVVKRLQDLGITPRHSKRGVWNTSTLGTMLRNRTYIGVGHYGSSYAVVPDRPWKKEGYKKVKKTSRRMRPKEEWINIPTPAIIDEDLFNRAQVQLKRNFEMSVRNKKNQYLLAGKIYCTCDRTRAGEGPQHGKHLYYRCTSRVHHYPLPSPCSEKGVNARIADDLVWRKIAKLMSSKELMLKQAKRWVESRQSKSQGPLTDTERVKKEIARYKTEIDRYTKAYGSGLFTIEQLQEYALPAKERISALEDQLAKAKAAATRRSADALPEPHELEIFAEKAATALKRLSFEQKRAIVLNAIDRVVATQQELQVYGHIPVKSHVEYKTSDRHRRSSERGKIHAFFRAHEKERAYRQLPLCHH